MKKGIKISTDIFIGGQTHIWLEGEWHHRFDKDSEMHIFRKKYAWSDEGVKMFHRRGVNAIEFDMEMEMPEDPPKPSSEEEED